MAAHRKYKLTVGIVFLFFGGGSFDITLKMPNSLVYNNNCVIAFAKLTLKERRSFGIDLFATLFVALSFIL